MFRNSPLIQLITGSMDPARFVALMVSLIVCVTIHEFSHAAAATWLGDTLPGQQGRLTLSPLAHLDPAGSLFFLLAGFGWGKPVQYNPYALRANPRAGPAIVALAGPASNILLAILLSLIVRALEPTSPTRFTQDLGIIGSLLSLLQTTIFINLLLAFFNLIPIFPLDGFSVLLGLLPSQLAYQYEQTRQWGMLILFALIFFGGGVLGALLDRPVSGLYHLLTGA